ncbi:MAG: Bax inhibitor-1/YccA family protein [Acidimicrobiales bacterium]
MAIANPALSPAKFQQAIDDEQPGWASPTGGAPIAGAAGPAMASTQAPPAGEPLATVAEGTGLRPPAGEVTGKTMTYGGTFTAILVYFVLLLAGGWFGWQGVTETTVTTNELTGQTTYAIHLPSWLFVVALVAFGVAIVTIFKPRIAVFTGPIYAVAEGAVLGAISAMYNAQFNGIVLEAVMATMAVFGVMLFLYATRLIRVTKRFRMMVIGSMAAILVLYLATWIISLFSGSSSTFLNQPTVWNIGLSVLIVAVASFNLMLQFDLIESAVEARAPRYMEWYGAFGLMIALVWLYLEILRLLALLNRR